MARTNMQEIEKIEIDRAEGRPFECGMKTARTIEQADYIIKEMHWTGALPGEGYHKVYVKVIFKDGSSVRDRIDINNWSFPRSVQEIVDEKISGNLVVMP